MSSVQQSVSEVKTQAYILPDGYKNDLFGENMQFFEAEYPALFKAVKDHRCEEYKICLTGNDTPNIYNVKTGGLVYSVKSKEQSLVDIRKDVDRLGMALSFNESFIDLELSKGLNIDPIQKEMNRGLSEIGPFGKNHFLSKAKEKRPLPKPKTDYHPYLRVYGIGIGSHITELIKTKTISYISIYEPNLDLFYVSLYTVPWESVFKYFSFRNRHIRLFVTTPPKEMVDNTRKHLSHLFRYLVSGYSRYFHFQGSPEITEAVRLENEMDGTLIQEGHNGWYEDQRAGLYYAARNIVKKNAIFNGKKSTRFFRAFVVGCGPSLNESIDYIKKNKDQAIIFSCGSAITPLLANGIVPDYEVCQERDWHTQGKDQQCHEKDFDPDLLNQITLLKLNVVTPLIDSYYKESLVFQKYNDPGSTLLGKDYPAVTNVNPTVTNAGVSIAAELGAEEIFLFGVDYGAPVGASRMHANNSMYDKDGTLGQKKMDDVNKERTLVGVFGETVETTHELAVSLRATESRILGHPNVRWINVGRGAAIKGTEAFRCEDLHKISRKIRKDTILAELRNCFDSDYPSFKIIGEFQTTILDRVRDYFHTLIMFSETEPVCKEDLVNNLILMNRAVLQRPVNTETKYTPPILLSGGIQEFIKNVYAQILFLDDKAAIEFFNQAMNVLEKYMMSVSNDLEELLGHVISDKDLEVKNTYQ